METRTSERRNWAMKKTDAQLEVMYNKVLDLMQLARQQEDHLHRLAKTIKQEQLYRNIERQVTA